MKISKTKNYNDFNVLQGNRNINELNKDRLKESFKKDYLINPIIVNDNMEVVDGQHRLQAAKELGLPVYYIKVDGYGLKQVQTLNASQKNWSIDDYVDGYINMGKQNYNIYKIFRKQYKLPSIQTIEILEGVRDSGARNLRNNFKLGNLKIKNLKESNRIAKGIADCGLFYDGYKRKAFVAAMTILLRKDAFDINVFLKKLKTYNSLMVDCINTNSYVELIEEIYNYRNRNKVSLRF